MTPPLSRVASPDPIGAEMRDALFATALPNAVMAAIFLLMGGRIAGALHDGLAWIALVAGLACAAVKLALIAVYRWRNIGAAAAPGNGGERYATIFALLSLGFASFLGMLGSRAFASDAVLLQMLATGLLFGYCSGLVAHTSIRPRLAASCIAISTLPVALGAAIRSDSAYHLLAGSLLCFMVAAFQSIRHMYGAIRQQIITRRAMARLAQVDPLTSLPNRLGLSEAFLSQAHRGQQIAVHYLDLDAFKPVNDRYGHATGDALLSAVGERVRSACRAQDTAARVGGDEFVILQSEVRDYRDADRFAHVLARRIMAPYEIDHQQIEIGVSLGFVMAEAGRCSLDELVACADAALYRAKQRGGGVGYTDMRPPSDITAAAA